VATTSTAQQIAEQIAQLTPEHQTKVLFYVYELLAEQRGASSVANFLKTMRESSTEGLDELQRLVEAEHEWQSRAYELMNQTQPTQEPAARA
jgi:hypothetical protein